MKTNEELHRELWRWCAETGKQKHQWPYFKKYKGIKGHSFCFACKEDAERGGEDCEKCPIDWEHKEVNDCCGCDSPYYAWEGSFDVSAVERKECKRIAAIIAELPWRPA